MCPGTIASRLSARTVRVRPAPPPPTDEETLRAAARAAAGYGAAGLLSLPRLPGRPRASWAPATDGLGGGGGGGGGSALPPAVVGPAVVDAARRGVAVGARALAYGGAVGLVGAALVAVLAARAAGVTSGGDGGGAGNKGALRSALTPLADAARGAAETVRDAVGVQADSPALPPPTTAAFAANLAGRLDGQLRRLGARVTAAATGGLREGRGREGF